MNNGTNPHLQQNGVQWNWKLQIRRWITPIIPTKSNLQCLSEGCKVYTNDPLPRPLIQNLSLYRRGPILCLGKKTYHICKQADFFRPLFVITSVAADFYFHFYFRRRPVIDVKAIEDQCPTQVLILVIHGGSVLDGPLDASVRKSDVTTFRGAFETLIRTHYPGLVGQVIVKCVACPAVCTEALAVLSSLSPYRQ